MGGNKMKKSTKKNKKGFTLIELLIVVAIIAILAAIAIPQFNTYKKRGYNASANSDNRNLRTGQEAMAADFMDYGVSSLTNQTGTPVTGAGAITTAGVAFFLCGDNTTTSCQNITVSPAVEMIVSAWATGGKNSHYAAASKHLKGDVIYGIDSTATQPYRKAGTPDQSLVAGDLATPTDGVTSVMTSPWITIQ
jgi:type IV pilus assembly protein PilA